MPPALTISKTKVEKTKLKEKKLGLMAVLWIVWLVSNRGKAEEADINGYDPTVLVVAVYDRLQLGRKKSLFNIGR